MQSLHIADRETAVGLAYCDYIPELLTSDSDLIDYVEIPFEMLLKNESALESVGDTPVVLHCASLSIAGNIPIADNLRSRLGDIIAQTKTPWLGEHLAFVRAQEPTNEPSMADAVIVDPCTGAYNVGYTVSPQYSTAILDRVLDTISKAEDHFGLPVLLENGPLYVSLPGSTMSQVQFISELCNRRPETQLLLDLSHLEITAQNSGKNVFSLLADFPIKAVVEVHLSGHSIQSNMHWDDHAQRAPKILFDLLEVLMKQVSPYAVTLEYNWDSGFPLTGVREDVARVRGIVDQG